MGRGLRMNSLLRLSCLSALFLLLELPGEAQGACLTTTGQTCVFPFTFGGVTYTSCTTAAATSCITTSGAKAGDACVFPWTWNGQTYYTCTTDGGFSTPWCSTLTDSSGNHVTGYWGDCPSDSVCYAGTTTTTTSTTTTTTTTDACVATCEAACAATTTSTTSTTTTSTTTPTTSTTTTTTTT